MNLMTILLRCTAMLAAGMSAVSMIRNKSVSALLYCLCVYVLVSAAVRWMREQGKQE